MTFGTDLPVDAAPHGVAERLVQAGLSILAEAGQAGLTLRRIAARAGVSHAAPAYHFGSMAGLEAAIATQGFAMFRQELTAILERQPADAAPLATLVAVNTGYLDFAHHRPALFRLMFNCIRHGDDRLRAEAARAWTILERVAAPFMTDRDPETLRTAIWAITHGYAVLNLGHPRPNAPAPAADFASVLGLLLRP